MVLSWGMVSPITQLIDAPLLDPVMASNLASRLRSGDVELDPVEVGEFNALSRLIYLHLRHRPELFDAALPLLDALADQGCSPFERVPEQGSSAYMELLMEDDSGKIVQWCLDLDCAPPSMEVDPASRIRLDMLEQILIEHPEAGGVKQTSTLDLFGFDLLHTWADGRSTLDRILARHYHHFVVNAQEPRKGFEFTPVQRGFTHLLKKVLKEDASSPAVYDLRLHAWHQAFRAHHRLHDKGSYNDWGSEQWQAALRQFDKTLLRARGVSGAPTSQQVDALWQDTIDHASTKTQDQNLAMVVAGAACYRFADNPEVPGQGVRMLGSRTPQTPNPTPRQKMQDLAHLLAAARIPVSIWQCQTPGEVIEHVSDDPGLQKMTRTIADLLPEGPAPQWLVQHDALLPSLLPMLSMGAIWSSNSRKVEEIIIQGASWPERGPWSSLIEQCEWAPGTQAFFDARALSSSSPSPSRSTTRRI